MLNDHADHLPEGAIEIANEVAEELDSFILGNKDWCDCNSRGTLVVRSKQSEDKEYRMGVGQWQIKWKKPVSEVEWKCAGGEDMDWQRANFNPPKREWNVKFTEESKTACWGWDTVVEESTGDKREKKCG